MTQPRNEQINFQERDSFSFDHPAVTADTTWKIWQAPRAFVIEWVRYINETGLAEDTTNVFAGSIKIGTTVAATIFDTDSDAAGSNSLAANTFVAGALSAVAGATVGAADDIVSLFADEGGSATLPAGRVIVGVRYL